MCLVARPAAGGSLATRMFIPHRVHTAIGVLAAVTVGTAAALPGSVAGRVCRPVADPAVPMDVMRLEHPGGWFDVVIDVAVHAGGVHLGRSAIVSPAPDGGDGLSEGVPVREITRFVELRGHVYAQVQQARLPAGT